MANTRRRGHAAEALTLVEAAEAALMTLNEIAGAALLLESIARKPNVDFRIAKVLRDNSLTASEAAMKLQTALAKLS
jgi:hypothetical protein